MLHQIKRSNILPGHLNSGRRKKSIARDPLRDQAGSSVLDDRQLAPRGMRCCKGVDGTRKKTGFRQAVAKSRSVGLLNGEDPFSDRVLQFKPEFSAHQNRLARLKKIAGHGQGISTVVLASNGIPVKVKRPVGAIQDVDRVGYLFVQTQLENPAGPPRLRKPHVATRGAVTE
ncbi:MAG: hypothetical protein VX768_20765 [Planctomycetota bacterium]|nr:hypothetical protein [Planctomycetota bacterium]